MFDKITNKKKFLLGFSSVVLFFLFLFPLFSSSQVKAQTGLDTTAQEAGLKQYAQGEDGLQSLAGQIIGNLLSMVGVLFFILIVYGGVLWMTARGDEDQVTRGRNTIIAASIGIVVILASYALTSFVLSALQGSNNTGGASVGETCQYNSDCAEGLECALTGTDQGVCQQAE